MVKNEFKVISIFKIFFRICKRIVEFCGKTSKFLPRKHLFIFCIFYLNKDKLIQQVCLEIYIKMKFLTLPRTKQKIKRRGSTI